MREAYPRIRRRAQKQHGIVVWLEELGFRSQHTSGRSFAPKGKTPVLKKRGNRFYLNQVSAFTNQGQLVFMVVEGNFNGVVFLRFLNKLARAFRQKIFLITDAHPAHLGKKISEWRCLHRQGIERFLLPGYSPEVNPVEYFNQDVKTNVAGKRRPRNKEELKKAVETFLRRKKKNPAQVKNYFHAENVSYPT